MRLIFSFAVLAVLFLHVKQAEAHPHEWMDLRTTPIFDANRNIIALRQQWLFDVYYTALSLPDFDTNGNKTLDAAEVTALADANLNNLKEFDYFTNMTAGGSKVAFAGIEDVQSDLENGRVRMAFTLKLKEPVNPFAQPVRYSIYDPSYYVEMIHDKKEPVSFSGIAEGVCRADIARPKPDTVWVELAKSLDKNAVAPEDLGRNFAEQIGITCK